MNRIWLVADRTNLYVVYDDRAWDKPTLAAPMPLDQAMPIAVEEVPTSQIRFGTNPKAWRFSPKLFQRVSVKAIVEGFIADTGT